MLVRGTLAGLLILAALTPAPAQAAPADDLRWSIQPSTAKGPNGRDYIISRAAPGERLTDYVGITNLIKKPLTFSVYGTDAHTTEDGSFALLPAARKPTDIGSWITLGAQRYTVPANTRLDVPFAITVPANATPGDHAGGIIASLAQEQTDANGQKILVDRRVAARVYLTVAGAAAPQLTIDTVRLEYAQSANPIDGGAMTVRYLVRNTGNLRAGGTGAIRVTGPFGWELANTGAAAIPELLPGSSITVTEKILGVQPTVQLAAHVDVQPVAAGATIDKVSRTTSVWAWPWALVGLLAVLLAYVGIRVVRRSRRKRRTAVTKLGSSAFGPGDAVPST
ncbi:WxL protein peptidoglycan domain-containing protein [Actinoplanes sp. NPDC051859]|uniref:WxL protein peptidoglycan domain-containing protein n=1 Tax=Actinoplanes sp. NPDC051859 TaxID=3363909 RepID=UPI003798063C